jgi:hypothetical protein
MKDAKTKGSPSELIPALPVERCILGIRGEKVILDADLAALYGVSTKALNQAVELSRCAAGESSRLVDNPAPEVDYHPMQHGSVLCFKFRSESRIKVWQKQDGCAKSKRHCFTGGLRGCF